jgi:hypothetical protein
MIKKLFIFLCAGVLILSGSFFSTAEAQLTAPTLSATAVSNSQIHLSWTDNNNGVYGYVIERSLSPGGGFVELANVSRKDTAYYDIGLDSGTTYYYRIMAYKRNETSSYSGVAGATTQSSGGVTVPSDPSNLTASAVSSSQINLTWQDNSNNETGFKIQRATSSSGPWTQIATVGSNTYSYANTGLASSTTYYYRVLAYNSSGNSAYSNTASATTQSGGGATIPSAPSNLSAAAASSSQINLSWQDNSSNETGFKIQRATSSSGPWTQIATVGANTSSYPDASLSASSTYYYRVLAYNSLGNSGYSNVANATTQSSGSTTVPDAPSNLTANAVSSSQINLTWQDNSNNETSFEIWRYQAGDRWITLPFQSANVTSYADEGLSPSTLYYYAVRAVNSVGVSSWSSLASATTLSGQSSDTTPPNVSITSPPSGSTYTTSQTVTIYATASDNVGVTKVEFYDNGVIKGTDTTNAYTYAWTFATADNGTHNWTAKAYDAVGNAKISTAVSYTVSVPVADTTPPTVPATLTSSAVSCSQVNLSWTASTDTGGSGLKGYNVHRGGTYLKQILAPSTSTSDTGLSASHSYSYTVSAIDNAGNQSAQSNSSVTITPTCADTIPPAVSITSPASGMTYSTVQTVTIVASASDNVGVSKVEFYDGTTLKATDTSSPYTYAWAFTSANNGTHSWKAKAYDAAGNSASSGAVSLTVNIATSSDGQTAWAEKFGSSGGDKGWAVAVDHQGNVIMTGQFAYDVDFGDGPLSSSSPYQFSNIFIAKYSPDGTNLWSASLETGPSADSTAHGIAVDSNDNIIVTGSCMEFLKFNGTTLYGWGLNIPDICVAKFSSTGVPLWAKILGSTGVDEGLGIAVDSQDNILLTGSFAGRVNFGGGTLTSASSSNDIFLVKYSPTGSYLWSKRFGDVSGSKGYAVAVDSYNNIFLTGLFAGTVNFGGGTLTSSGNTDIFLSKFSPAGNHLWSKRFGGYTYDSGNAVAVDNSGNVVLTGYFQGAADFGGGPLTSTGGKDIFIAKFSSTGSHLWSERTGGTYDQEATAISVDGSGNIIVTGPFRNNVDFGGGPLYTYGYLYSDIFIAKLSSTGTHIWSESFGFGDMASQSSSSVAVDSGGNSVVTGFFQGTVDFGTGPLTSAGADDIFLLKLTP